MTSFATFWAGPALSSFEKACLGSFAARGYEVIVYSYNGVAGLPDGVQSGDAREVAPEEATRRFVVNGGPNLSHFSDYFRYRLFQRTTHAWVDSDMVLIRPLDFDAGSRILARERADSICGAIMSLPRGPELDNLVARTEALMDTSLSWGQTGPGLLTETFGKDAVFAVSHPPEIFFPISHGEFWRVFLPSERDWCERACAESYGVHLWNNLVDRAGVWKAVAPPVGSWLHARFEADGLLGLFDVTYPEDVMARMIENWSFRKNGHDLGIKTVARQIFPSAVRTLRHYLGPRFLS